MKYLSQFLIILGFTLTGEALQRIIPLPIPSSVYGLALLFLALNLKLVKVEQVKDAGSFLVSIMPILFVPPLAKILLSWDIISPQIAAIAIICVTTTVFIFAVSGLVTKWLQKKKDGDKDA